MILRAIRFIMKMILDGLVENSIQGRFAEEWRKNGGCDLPNLATNSSKLAGNRQRISPVVIAMVIVKCWTDSKHFAIFVL